MAFVLDQSWEVAAARRLPLPGLRVWRVSSSGGRWSRDAVGLIGTVLVHALLFLAIVLKVFGGAGEQPTKSPDSALKLIDLSAPAAAPVLNTETDQAPPPPRSGPRPPPPPPEVAEWTEKRVAAPPLSVAGLVDGNGRSGTTGTGNATSGSGSGYDPYAGAAPLHSGGPASLLPGSGVADAQTRSASAADLTASLGGRIVAIARSRWPKLHGTARFALTVDGRGKIIAAKWLGGTLAGQGIEDVKALLLEPDVTLPGLPNRATMGPIQF